MGYKNRILTQLVVQGHERIDLVFTQLTIKHAERVMSIAMGGCPRQLIWSCLVVSHERLIKAIVDNLLRMRSLLHKVVHLSLSKL